ncbi:MAG: (d)CMP kinase [Bryobacteraceae bacterium]
MRRVVIAIDGPAGAGKSTIARRIAAKLGFTYIDTGAMYRAVALWALREKLDPQDRHRMEQLAVASAIAFEPGSARVLLNSADVTEAIRAPEAANAASVVATMPAVRRALVEKQRAIAEGASVVMEGRDIGTVVFPNADVKIFLDASPEERVRRRVAESHGDASELAREIEQRDERDRGRAESPLVQAPDAIYIDTTGMTLDQVEEAVLKVVRERITNGKDFHR